MQTLSQKLITKHQWLYSNYMDKTLRIVLLEIAKIVKLVHLKGVTQYFW